MTIGVDISLKIFKVVIHGFCGDVKGESSSLLVAFMKNELVRCQREGVWHV